jgi:mannose-6-phosphate isomerase-like protein (cupin superfamily)
MMFVFKEPTEYSFVKVGIKGKKFIKDESGNTAGIALIETENGHQTTIIEYKCDFIYYVLEGKGFFEINDTREDFSKGDLVVVPHGAKFTYKGKAKFLLVTGPPFYPEQEETL